MPKPSPAIGTFRRRGKKIDVIDFQITIPPVFRFKTGDIVDVDAVLSVFDWSLSHATVEIDFRQCMKARFETVALVVLYVWHLQSRSCDVRLRFGAGGISHMWKLLGGSGWLDVLNNETAQFAANHRKPLIAVRNQRDFGRSLKAVESYTKSFNVEYEKTLRYVISELLYNTLEHGTNWYMLDELKKRIPSLIQFNWYSGHNELAFVVADLGMGIKKHLEQAYPPFLSHEMAIRHSLLPNVSGTFGIKQPYVKKDNAGVGLYLSSQIIKRLDADMYIASSDGLVHVSPTDVTGRTLLNAWPGTIVLVYVKLGVDSDLNLQRMMSDFRKEAEGEIKQSLKRESGDRLYLIVFNTFGRYAEDKAAAIRYRDRTLIPALDRGQSVLIDFDNVVSSPHSFLSALLASAIQMLEMSAYKRIKIVNATPDIRETIDFIFEKETS